MDDISQFLAIQKSTKKLFCFKYINTGKYLVIPPEKSQLGHIPYSFTKLEMEQLLSGEPVTAYDKDWILDKIMEQINRFIVAPDLVKYLILGDILVTYCLEWINILHYLFFVGDTESGKSSALHLCSRAICLCHLGEDIPMADIYNYLGVDEEGTGTIMEDEVDGLEEAGEKLRMYKSSYAKGSTKARIVGYQGLKKHQVYYHTFCPKWFSGERLPNDKGMLERIVKIFMLLGNPQSNIKDPSPEEMRELSVLRNLLLVWKIINIPNGLQPITTNLTRRNRELWESYLRAMHGTKYYDKCLEVVEFYVKQRQESMKNTLEAAIIGLVLSNLDENNVLDIMNFWENSIANNPDFPGIMDGYGRVFHSDEFGKISLNSLSKMLVEKFQASKGSHTKAGEKRTHYVFRPEILDMLVKKYQIKPESK